MLDQTRPATEYDQLGPLEEKRKTLLKRIWLFFLWFIPIAVGITAAFTWFLVYLVNIEPWDMEADLGGFSALVFMGYLSILVVSLSVGKKYVAALLRKSDYSATFRREIIGRLVAQVSKGAAYRPDAGITRDEFAHSALFNDFPTRYSAEDGISGKIEQTNFHFSEVHALHEGRGDGESSKQFTIFKGLFFVADFHKAFQTKTIVVPDFLKHLEKWQGLNRISLEDPEFERYFEVYGEDQVESRYVLSPSFMTRVIDFRKRIRKFLYLSLVDGKLYIAIPDTKSLFKPPVFRSIQHAKSLNALTEQLQLMVGIVADLNLNTQIWRR